MGEPGTSGLQHPHARLSSPSPRTVRGGWHQEVFFSWGCYVFSFFSPNQYEPVSEVFPYRKTRHFRALFFFSFL